MIDHHCTTIEEIHYIYVDLRREKKKCDQPIMLEVLKRMTAGLG